MVADVDASRRLPGDALGTSSVTRFLGEVAPEPLPGRRPSPPDRATAPHATTIVALVTAEGVVMAGDRRATTGNLIASRAIEKVCPADAYSLVGVAATAGTGIELLRLFRVGLEHHEKVEGAMLSLDGKASRLAALIRGDLGAAARGPAAISLFAGFDPAATDPARAGRLFAFDVTGGYHEASGYDALGSGSILAKGALKKRYRRGLSTDEAIRLAIEALYDAADDDTATGGPDLIRRIYPVVMSATAAGTRRLTEAETRSIAESISAARMENPGG